MDFAIQHITFLQIIEFAAVILGLAYIILAIRVNYWCWCMAFCSGALFLWVFWNVDLYLMSLLQFYYMSISIYGFLKWRSSNNNLEKKISKLKPKTHLYVIMLMILPSLILGWLLNQYSDDAFPYLDTITTLGSLITTWMVAKKILENWLYWIAIDATSIYIYIERELHLTVLLFIIYLIMAAFGYREWKTSYQQQSMKNWSTH